MTIWKGEFTLEEVNRRGENTLVRQLGIEFIEIGDNYIRATMPVDKRTVQPAGILHGGASLALAETLGGVAGFMCIDREKQYCVGMEINANHIRPAHLGTVCGVVSPIHIGRRTHVWAITINDQENRLVCISRITLSILNKDE